MINTINTKLLNYYDVSNTITNPLATPNPPALVDPDDPGYNRERVYVALGRNTPYLWVANDAAPNTSTIFVIISHDGEMQWSTERPIYPQQFKVYYNVYEIRLRSAVAGTPYRATEYEIGMQ